MSKLQNSFAKTWLHYVFKSCLYFPQENRQLFLMKHILQINKKSVNKMIHVYIRSVSSLILSIIFYEIELIY